jgi:hypothetical protein
VQFLESLVSEYCEATMDKMPVHGAWRFMNGEELWKHLVRIIAAMGRSAPSYRLIASPDFERLAIHTMKAFQDKNGMEALVKRTHLILTKYNVRYCSPKKETSLKAWTIVNNLNEPAIVEGTEFVLLKNMRNTRKAGDDRFYLMGHVHGYCMKSASEFLTEVGYSQDYMGFEEVFREEVCPELGIKPSELDAIIFWNYRDILKTLKRSAK